MKALAFINKFNRIISKYSKINDINSLQEIVGKMLSQIIGVKDWELYLYDYDEEKLLPTKATDLKQNAQNLTERTADPIYAQVFKSKKKLSISKRTNKNDGIENGNKVYLPILNNEVSVGVLEIASCFDDDCTDEQSAILTFICNLTATFYENILDKKEIRKVKQEILDQSKFPNENPNPIIRVGIDDVVLYTNQVTSIFFRENKLNKGEKLPPIFRKFTLEAKEKNKIIKCELKDADKSITLYFAPFLDSNYVNIYGIDITERIQIEDKLKKERNLFDRIFESISDPIFYKNTDHIYLRCNKAFAELHNKLPFEIMGKSDLDLYSEKEAEAFIQSDVKIIQTKKSSINEEWFIYKNGTPEFLNTIKLPAFDDNGKVQGIVGVCRNITKIKKAESLQKQLNVELQKAVKTLKSNEKYLKNINEFASSILKKNSIDEIVWEVTHVVIKELGFVDCIIYLFDEDKKYLIQRAAYGTKQTKGNFIKDPIKIPTGKGIVGSVGKTGVFELIADTSKDERYIVDDQQRLSELTVPIIANGEVIGVIDTEHPDKNFYTKNHIERLQTVSSLISTRMKNAINQEKLESAQKDLSKLSTAIDQSSLAVVITDLNGIIEFINPAFTEISGYSAEECLGKKTSMLNSGVQSKEFYKKLWTTISQGKKWTGELINKMKDGTKYWVLTSVSPIRDFEGKIINYVQMQTDISHLKQLEEDLIKAKLKAEEADQAKSMFLATMSHEIRTPLNAIYGMIKLFEDTKLDQNQHELVKGLDYSSNNLMRIVNDILDFEKIESGQLQLESTSFNFAEFIQQIIETFEFKSEEKNIDLNYEIDERICKHLMGDSLRLQQILINLLNNAIKFTKKGSVNLFCRFIKQSDDHCWVEFVVRDTGIGIEKNNLDKIFERFKQEDDSTTRQYGGTGLGLAISRQLVNLMGGEISVESQQNTGSRFSFTIRLSEADESSIPKQKSTQIDKNLLKGKKILLVEDNTFNQYIAKSIIEKWNVAVDVVDNGKMAVNYLQKKKVDLILMDKQMPVMDGLAASRIIRNELKLKIPIIALTANVVKGVVQSCLNAGMNDYIAKPFEPAELFDKIVKNLDLNPTESNKDTLSIPEQPKTQKLYDLSKLTYMLEGNKKQIKLMLHKFIETTPEYILELKESYEKEDLERFTMILHKVKSSVNLLANSVINTQIKNLYNDLSTSKNKAKYKNQIPDVILNLDLLIEQLKKKY